MDLLVARPIQQKDPMGESAVAVSARGTYEQTFVQESQVRNYLDEASQNEVAARPQTPVLSRRRCA